MWWFWGLDGMEEVLLSGFYYGGVKRLLGSWKNLVWFTKKVCLVLGKRPFSSYEDFISCS